MERIKVWLEFSRPFTLLGPFIGFVSAGVMAWNARPEEMDSPASAIARVLVGALAAACLNAASNAINQIFDLDIDAVNKPTRPLPSGRMSIREAWVFTFFFYALTFLLAAWVGRDFFVIVAFTTFVTYAYSGPPFRTKRWGIPANITIAIPRGCLLVVAGWSSLSSPIDMEPWLIGMVMGLYILGAATTKDFSDMEGDKKYGCITLPIKYGIRTSAWMISPFFILPFLLLGYLALSGRLSGNSTVLAGLSVVLSLWGSYVAWLILRHPESLATEANHVSWKHMYLLMVVTQIGIAIAYLL